MSEAKELIVQGCGKQLRPGAAAGHVSAAGGDLHRHQCARPGLATTLVLTLTNASISAVRRWVPSEVRIPIYVMIIAAVVSIVQMLINAYAFGLYQSLGIFIPLIVTNCIVVGRAEAVAAKKPVGLSALDGMAIGLGATGVMVTLGSMRELLGNGTLFDGADQLLGGWAKSLRIEVVHFDSPFLLAMLPPGAFIGLGLLLAVKYLIDENEGAQSPRRGGGTAAGTRTC